MWFDTPFGVFMVLTKTGNYSCSLRPTSRPPWPGSSSSTLLLTGVLVVPRCMLRNCCACRSLPDQGHDPKRCHSIVREVAQIIAEAANRTQEAVIGRDDIIAQAITATEKLVEEYFDVDDIERMLIADTDTIIIHSVRPTRARINIPTIKPTNHAQRAAYTHLLCNTLNDWASTKCMARHRRIPEAVSAWSCWKRRSEGNSRLISTWRAKILSVIIRLQQTAAKNYGSFELVRGLKVFDKNLLYITKPLGQRFWADTAALNDADEIASTILTRTTWEGA